MALAPPRLASLPRKQLEAMRSAGLEIIECQRVLTRGGLNVVGELLRGAGPFVEYDHYPEDDVFDDESDAQYYYHAHRGLAGEHGHFHTFLRGPGMPPGVAPSDAPHTEPWPSADAALAHLISISMDAYGAPIGLFAPVLSQGAWFGREVVGAIAPAGVQVAAGAFLFGIGMQLAGGCGSGTLYTAGGG